MKNLTHILFTLMLVFLVGCSSDDPEYTDIITADLSGNWRLSSYSYTGSTKTILNETVTEIFFNGEAWELHLNMVISEDPNSFSTNGYYFLDHYETNSNGNEVVYFIESQLDETGSWILDNNSFVLTINGDSKQGYISQLSDTSLKFIINNSTSDTDDDGTQTFFTRTDTYQYTRTSN